MPQSLKNFLADRNKFSPKKKREPIVQHESMVFCKAHDGGQKRACAGEGCWHFALQKQLKEGARPSRRFSETPRRAALR